MATLVATNGQGSGEVLVTETTLDGTLDTFVYQSSKNQTLILRNDTAGALVPVIDGDGATTISISGVGYIDLSAGYTLAPIGIGEIVTIKTDTIKEYLKGTIEITNGIGLTAQLLEY